MEGMPRARKVEALKETNEEFAKNPLEKEIVISQENETPSEESPEITIRNTIDSLRTSDKSNSDKALRLLEITSSIESGALEISKDTETAIEELFESLSGLDIRVARACAGMHVYDAINQPEKFDLTDSEREIILQEVLSDSSFKSTPGSIDKYIETQPGSFGEETLHMFMEQGMASYVFNNPHKFPPIDSASLFLNNKNLQSFLQKIETTDEKIRDEVGAKLSTTEDLDLLESLQTHHYFIERKIPFFSQEIRDQLANALIKNNLSLHSILENIELFTDIDQQSLVDSILAEDQIYSNNLGLKAILSRFGDLPKINKDRVIFNSLDSEENIELLASRLDSTQGLSKETNEALVQAFMLVDFAKAVAINRSFTPPFIPELASFASIAGPYGSKELYQHFLQSGANEELFKEKIAEVRNALLNSNSESLQTITEDPVLRDASKAFVRFQTSSWGSHDDAAFVGLIDTYIEGKDSYAPLPEGYTPGTIEVIKQRKREGTESHEYSPEFLERWKVLVPSLKEAEKQLNDPSAKSKLYRQFLRVVMKERIELDEALKRAPNEFAQRNITDRIERLSSVSVRSEEGLADAFEKLYDRKKSPELAEVFRQYGFMVAQQESEQQTPTTFSELPSEAPNAQEIAKVLEFVQHVAHQETWEKKEAFASKEVQQGLDSLFHTKALETEIARMQTPARTGGESVAIDIKPSRDILTELSGHIGDACWASRSEILRDYPQISSLTFFQNEQVAGAGLLIDAETESGEPLTIIRGLNPLEAVINKLDAASFVDGVRSYMQNTTTERGRKLAIVIDDHSGGAATNRPLLFAYLSGLKNSLTPVRGLDLEKTTFNGYDIRNSTYYLP